MKTLVVYKYNYSEVIWSKEFSTPWLASQFIKTFTLINQYRYQFIRPVSRNIRDLLTVVK